MEGKENLHLVITSPNPQLPGSVRQALTNSLHRTPRSVAGARSAWKWRRESRDILLCHYRVTWIGPVNERAVNRDGVLALAITVVDILQV